MRRWPVDFLDLLATLLAIFRLPLLKSLEMMNSVSFVVPFHPRSVGACFSQAPYHEVVHSTFPPRHALMADSLTASYPLRKESEKSTTKLDKKEIKALEETLKLCDSVSIGDLASWHSPKEIAAQKVIGRFQGLSPPQVVAGYGLRIAGDTLTIVGGCSDNSGIITETWARRHNN